MAGFYLLSEKESYETSVHGWPDDAVAVTDEEYKVLFAGQASGKLITSDESGRPTLTDPVIDWHARAEQQRQSLITAAKNITSDWRTELQLEIISDNDKASLVKWMGYIKALKALDLSGIKDEEAFEKIAWPAKSV